jgi:RimJ/RimL family protein N-acetyltransferase
MTFPLPPNPTVHTPRLVLRLAEQSDLPMLLAVNGNDTVTRFLPYPTWKDLADGEAWFGRVSARQAAGDAAQFVIVHKESGQVIGACLLFRFDIPSGRAELGYVLGQAHWGGGYMLEAMQAFVAAAFGPWGLRRLEAEINPRNHASARLLGRLGFVQEGLLRQRWVNKGEVYDSALFGLLRSDGAAPQEAIAAG